ncbi:MAG: ribose 5-phosphate isomerase B [Candidatus Peregrinibacteria bacterium]|nr:ribose 5-phosphate isomerase B [Candidatus Peregrinibacteria bacterium]MDZ4245279.1 ribose 5-phosphate isomerase B [Candidatus Gracilibacteria bacterium]
MHIYLGADHAGYEMKEALQAWLKETTDHSVIDLGTFSTDPVDYPVIGREVAEKVFENEGSRGILVCGSGEGMCMAANKMRNVRAALADTPERAKASREHNDANIVCLGSRFTDLETAKKIVETFLTTEFSTEERHQKRVDMIDGNVGIET